MLSNHAKKTQGVLGVKPIQSARPLSMIALQDIARLTVASDANKLRVEFEAFL